MAGHLLRMRERVVTGLGSLRREGKYRRELTRNKWEKKKKKD